MNLVIQGAAVAARDLEQLSQLSGALQVLRLGPGVCRLNGAQQRPGIAEYCARARLDFGFVPQTRRLADMELLAIDMDSTLIQAEVIDELAKRAGVGKRVSEITERAMRGEIAFEPALRERVALRAHARHELHEVWVAEHER